MLTQSFKTLSVVSLAGSVLFATDARANVDSFFDIFVDAGECRWRALDSSSPTVFPPAAGSTIDTEMLSLSLSHTDPLNETITDLGGGSFQVDSFFDVTYEVTADDKGKGGDGGSNAVNVVVVWGTTMRFTPDGSIPAGSRQTDYDLDYFDLTSGGPFPPPPPGSPLLRLSPAHDHHGHVTVLKISDPGDPDTFQIDSFFDIHFEISLDDGSTWQTATSSTSLSESEIYVVPEPASAVLLLVGAGLVVRRRRG